MTEPKFTPGPWKSLYKKGFSLEGNVHVVMSDARFPAAFVPAWDAPNAEEEDGTVEAIANASLIAAAPGLFEAGLFARAAQEALEAYERDYGEPLPDDHEIGRIDDSRSSASFRVRVGHIRRLAAALSKAEG